MIRCIPLRWKMTLLVPFILLGCANQKEPGGGPVDKTPPRIIATTPLNNGLNVQEGKLTFAFDKYVDERLFTESVFISPSPGELSYDWSGTKVEVTFEKPLRPATTYVVTIGTDLVDLHQNRLAQAFTLAFSTGTEIDRGGIEGRILTRQAADVPSGVMIFAYRLDGRNADTLNPRTVPPDYITQTGKDGSFALRHIAMGGYRLLAVRDDYHNLLYDPEVDDFGIPSAPILLTPGDTLRSGLMIRMAREDTTAPRLIKAEARDRRHLIVQFSEPMDWKGMIPEAFSVTDTLGLRPLRIWSLVAANKPLTILTLVTEAQDTNVAYRMVVSGVRDTTGLPISPAAKTLLVHGTTVPDTLRPRLTGVSLPDSARNVDRNVPIRLTFSDAIARPVPDTLFVLRDGAGKRVPLKLEWEDGATLTLRPTVMLQGESWYRLTAPFRNLHDLVDRPLVDSTRTLSFMTLDPEMFASIEGRVVDWKARTPGARLYVVARGLGGHAASHMEVAADATGAFLFSEVVDGRYVLQAFEDLNGNGAYDPGTPWPYRLSEPLGVESDTLKVRARWPLDGVVLRMMPEVKVPLPPVKAKADTMKVMKGK